MLPCSFYIKRKSGINNLLDLDDTAVHAYSASIYHSNVSSISSR